ncbi:MAG: hypothetical protein ACUVUC_09465 [Thermoguttaceae bacterium]
MAKYNTGPMPGTDLRYEDFEGFLASYALTLRCLEKSGRTSDPQDYKTIIEILNGFAQRHGVQPPLKTLSNPRSRRALARPQEFTNEELVQMINSFGQDFGIGRVYPGNKYDLDAAERVRLGRIILEILDRYALADIVYRNVKGERVPIRIKRWVFDANRRKKLSESVREWRSWHI